MTEKRRYLQQAGPDYEGHYYVISEREKKYMNKGLKRYIVIVDDFAKYLANEFGGQYKKPAKQIRIEAGKELRAYMKKIGAPKELLEKDNVALQSYVLEKWEEWKKKEGLR